MDLTGKILLVCAGLYLIRLIGPRVLRELLRAKFDEIKATDLTNYISKLTLVTLFIVGLVTGHLYLSVFAFWCGWWGSEMKYATY